MHSPTGELSDLEDFDLTRGAVKQIAAGDVTSGVGVRLDLQSEWNALLASVLAGRELGADAVHADEHGRVTTGVPYTLQRVHLPRIDLDVQQSVRQRYVCRQFSLNNGSVTYVGLGTGHLGHVSPTTTAG